MADSSNNEGSSNNLEDEELDYSDCSLADYEVLETRSTTNRLQEEFEDIKQIGQGGFGTVFKAKNKVDGAVYAVKRIRITTNMEKELREVQLHTSLNHENVVRYYNAWRAEEKSSNSEETSESSDSENPDISEDASHGGIEFVGTKNSKEAPHTSQQIFEYLYIQTEFCERGNLRQCIDDNLYQDEHRVWQFFREITEGLSYIHKQGVFHRDLKPENIFLTSSLNIKIGDFGLATSEPRQAEQSTVSDVGTFLYMAPEAVARYPKPDKRTLSKTDIYSLGVIFFEMNYRPCETQSERRQVFTGVRSKEIMLPTDFLNGKTNTPQEEILRWLINEDPEGRPSADKILKSPLLPELPEEEKKSEIVITKILSNPQCRLYKRLVAKLFEQPAYYRVDDISDAREGLNFRFSRKQETVRRICSQIVQQHGAQPLTIPLLLLPSLNTCDDYETAVRIMDCTGKVMMLAPDLRVSFVRYLSQIDVSSLRRYTIDHVYRKTRYHGISQMEHLECAFDIIEKTSPATFAGAAPESKSDITNKAPNYQERTSSLTQYTGDGLPCHSASQADDTEIIRVVITILENFRDIARNGFTCHLNHKQLIQAILLYVGVPVEKLDEAVSAISVEDLTEDNNTDDDYYSKILSKLSGEQIIDARVDELLKFEGSIDDLSNELKEILDAQSQASDEARSGLHDLRMIIRRLNIVVPKLECHIRLGLLTSARNSSGIVFQITSSEVPNNQDVSTAVFAFGYRYDKMLNQLRRLNYERDILRGAGVSINIDLIAKSLVHRKRVEANVIGGKNTSSFKFKRQETVNRNEESSSTVDKSTYCVSSSTMERGTSEDSQTPRKDIPQFQVPSNNWDISIYQDRIFVAAYASGMHEYALNGQEKSCWQAPSRQGGTAMGSDSPPDIVYTVHTMLDGRVLVGLLKSRSVVVLYPKPPPAADACTSSDGDLTTWEIERSIKLDAQPWRLSSDGSNRIAVILANDDPRIRPGTKITMISLSDSRCSVYPLSFPISAVDVSESKVFVASLREINDLKRQKRCMVMAYNENFVLSWKQDISDNVFDVACDSAGCTVYLALGVSRSVMKLNGSNGNILATVLPYYRESPFRLSLANGPVPSLAVLRYDRKTVEVHEVELNGDFLIMKKETNDNATHEEQKEQNEAENRKK